MHNRIPWLAGLFLVILGYCPAAWADSFDARLLDGDVSGAWELFGDTSPAPACGSGPWAASLSENGSYLFTGGEDVEPCISSWVVYCNADSLGYKGSWTTDDPTDYSWNFSFVDCVITARFSFPDPILIHVQSESTGVLQSDSHGVAVTPENGDELVLLGPEPTGEVNRDLPAGIYTISMVVDVVEHNTHYDYQSHLKVWWELQSEVSARNTSWSGIKALYR